MSLVPLDYGSSDSDSEADGKAVTQNALDKTEVGVTLSNVLTTHIWTPEFSVKNVTFHDEHEVPCQTTTVRVRQLLDADYGSYIWPSALVLAAYIHHCRHRFAGTRVIELGCGTGLPGLLAAKVGAAQVLLTDAPIFAHVLDNANVAVTMNGLDGVCDVQGVPWGVFPPLPPAPASTMANSVMDSILEEESPRSEHSFDFIIGADVFYEPASFDDLLATVAYILMHSLSTAEFITAYQERSSRRTIQHLLDKWGLTARIVDKVDFGGWGSSWSIDGQTDSIPPEIGSVILLIISRVTPY